MTTQLAHRTLAQIHTALTNLARWRGWTDADRVLVNDLARSVAEIDRRYQARRTLLRRQEGNRYARR